MIQIPFYKVSDLYLDAYFMDKLSKPYLRIFLVKANLTHFTQGYLQPIPFDRLLSLLDEGYKDLGNINVNKEKMTFLENLVSSIYNVGYFMKRREEEITLSTLIKFYKMVYDAVLKTLKKENNHELVYIPLDLSPDKILLDNKVDEAYTFLFNSDEKFKAEVLNLLSGKVHK